MKLKRTTRHLTDTDDFSNSSLDGQDSLSQKGNEVEQGISSQSEGSSKSSSALDRLRSERKIAPVSQGPKFERHVLQSGDFDDDEEMKLFTTQKFSLESSSEEQLQLVQNALKQTNSQSQKEVKEETPRNEERVVGKKKKEKKKKDAVKKEEEVKIEKEEVHIEKIEEEKPKSKREIRREEKRRLKEQKEAEKARKRKEKEEKKSKRKLFGKKKEEKAPVVTKEDLSQSDVASISEISESKEEVTENSSNEPIGRFGRKKKEKVEKVKEPLSPEKKLLLSVVGVLLVLLAGYSYVVLILYPQNNPSEEQVEVYDKLVDYADEWDMLSDTEKNELLDIEKKYDKLLNKQKKSINEYYKEQTGLTLKEIYDQLNGKQKEETDETNATYRVLYDYFVNWDTHTENLRMAVLTYKGLYDSLSTSLQTKINDICKVKTGVNFNTLYRQYNEVYVSETGSISNMYPTYRNEIRDEYQGELDALQSLYRSLALKETEYQDQKRAMSESDKKYKNLIMDMEYNEVTLKQCQSLIDFYSQIVEQYNTVPSSIVP